jgi:hypothetical protein
MKSKPQVVQAAVKALIESCRALQSSETLAAQAAEKAGLPAHSIEVANSRLFKADVPYYGVDGGINRKQIEATFQILKDNGDIDKLLTFDQVVDMHYVDQALKELGPYHA